MVFGFLWIALTDHAVIAIADSQEQLSLLQTLKGWVFIVVAGTLIYGLTYFWNQRLMDSRDRLLMANQQIRVFNRVFRHNFRNKLNLVDGYLDTAIDEIEDESLVSMLEVSRSETEDILHIAEKLRVLEKIKAESLESATVDIVSAVEGAVEHAQSAYPEATIVLHAPQSVDLIGDDTIEYAIREVLINALDHHHRPASEREVRITIVHSGRRVTVQVHDNGPGIPPGELDALNEGSETPLTHMSGVGLWLVTWLTQLNDGSVTYDTNFDGGTSVTFRFDAVA